MSPGNLLLALIITTWFLHTYDCRPNDLRAAHRAEPTSCGSGTLSRALLSLVEHRR